MVASKLINRGRCDECKRRKKRCVGEGTECDLCKKKGLTCTNHNTLQIVHFQGSSSRKRQRVQSSEPTEQQTSFQFQATPEKQNVQTITPQPQQSFQSRETSQPPLQFDPQLIDHEIHITSKLQQLPEIQQLYESSSSLNPSASQSVSPSPPSPPSISSPTIRMHSLPKPSSSQLITHSSLVNMIKENLPSGAEIIAPDGLDLDKAPKIYLPKQKLELSNSISEPPILHDEVTIKFFAAETIIPKEFSLLDFLLSATRVNFVDLSTCHLEEPVSFDEIEKLLKISRSKRTMDTLKERGYLVSSKTSSVRDAPISPISPDSSEKSLSTFRSVKDVNFNIDLENLRTHFYIQKGSVAEDVKTEKQRFSNLPDSIDPDFADDLFQRFCAISQETNYSSLDLDSLPSYDEAFETSKDYVKINFLKVCFPLIFGNVTVLKCVLIVSYYRWKNIDPMNEYLQKQEKCIENLHLGILEELQSRLGNCFSLCCDHSLLCVLLLLSTEVVTGLRGLLWRKLLKLAKDMIVLRGGVPKLLESLTGLCLLKLLSVHLSVGGLFSFEADEIDNSTHSLSLADYFHILDSHNQLDFFDNANYYSKLGLNDMKEIVRSYGHITQLYNLSVISYNANNERGDNTLRLYGNYDSVSLATLELVLNDAATLERSILEFVENPYYQSNLPHHHKLQVVFAQKAALLYLNQMVYRQTSLSPKTVLTVKDLVKDAEQLFDELQNLSIEECQRSVIFILPLFLLGVDLISEHKRSWYKEQLITLYASTRKAPLLTCVDLLEKIWELNVGGLVLVDWRALAQKHEMDICLCA